MQAAQLSGHLSVNPVFESTTEAVLIYCVFAVVADELDEFVVPCGWHKARSVGENKANTILIYYGEYSIR